MGRSGLLTSSVTILPRASSCCVPPCVWPPCSDSPCNRSTAWQKYPRNLCDQRTTRVGPRSEQSHVDKFSQMRTMLASRPKFPPLKKGYLFDITTIQGKENFRLLATLCPGVGAPDVGGEWVP